MAKHTPYTTCAACGAALDSGERCDCAQQAETRRGFYSGTETPEEKARRREFVFALMEGNKKRRRGA